MQNFPGPIKNKLFKGQSRSYNTTISILLGGIIIRIILLAICYSKSSQGCKLMGLDLRNDILTSVVALTCAVIGDRYWPLADPIGAIVVW